MHATHVQYTTQIITNCVLRLTNFNNQTLAHIIILTTISDMYMMNKTANNINYYTINFTLLTPCIFVVLN
jgi:hypothetical protein